MLANHVFFSNYLFLFMQTQIKQESHYSRNNNDSSIGIYNYGLALNGTKTFP